MESPAGNILTARTRVMLVEDQASIREMLADVISRLPEFDVVAQAATLNGALRLASTTQPDVIILDWIFPGGGGRKFLREMQPNRLHARVLVLSGHTDEETVREALMGGARGYFEKGGKLEEFIHGLRAVAAGGAYFGPIAARIVERLVDANTEKRPDSTPTPDHSAEAAVEAPLFEPAVVPSG